MKITCHSCAAKYTVSDEKVQGKTVKMKCRKCGATIVVGGAQHADSPQDEATVAAGGPAEAGGDPPAGSFLVNVNDGDQRTMTLAEVVDAYRGGVVNGDTYVWADGMTDWQPISENAAINGALGGNGTANGNGGGYAVAAPEPLAAAPAPAREEPRAAARRDSGRRSGDLFSGGMGDGGLSSSLSSSSSAGKRDENSVLFSLSALTSTAAAPSKPSSATTATKEDSGLIDLKALAAAPAPAAAAAPMLESVGLFPLGAPVLAPPPVAAPVAAVAEPPKAKSNMTVVLVLGVLAVIGISAAVFFAVKSGGNATPTATVAQNTTPTTPATDATPPPTTPPTTATTTPPAANTDAAPPASGATSTTPVTNPGPGTGKPNVTGPKPTTTPTTAPTPTTKPTSKPTSACPCPPGDLMCAMQKCAGKK